MSELNLLPPYLKKKKLQKTNSTKYVLAGIIGLGIILLLVFAPIYALQRANSKEADYRKQSEQVNGDAINRESENIKQQIDTYKQYIAKVEYLTQNKISISNKIHELEPYVPNDIVFDKLSFSVDSLIVNGSTKNYDSISEFTANVQMSGDYQSVRVSNIATDGQTADDIDASGNKEYKFTVNAIE